jgi:hypothetical protein
MKTESAWAVVDQPSSDVPVRQKNAGLHRGWPQMIFDNMLATRGCLPCSRKEGISHQEFHLPNRGNRDRQVFVSSCRSQTCLRVGSESLTSMGQMPRGIGDTAVAHFKMRYEVQYQRINYSTSLSHWRLVRQEVRHTRVLTYLPVSAKRGRSAV